MMQNCKRSMIPSSEGSVTAFAERTLDVTASSAFQTSRYTGTLSIYNW